MKPIHYRLTLEILEGERLPTPSTAGGGLPHTYVTIALESRPEIGTKRTKMAHATASPKWCEQFIYDGCGAEEKLTLSLVHQPEIDASIIVHHPPEMIGHSELSVGGMYRDVGARWLAVGSQPLARIRVAWELKRVEPTDAWSLDKHEPDPISALSTLTSAIVRLDELPPQAKLAAEVPAAPTSGGVSQLLFDESMGRMHHVLEQLADRVQRIELYVSDRVQGTAQTQEVKSNAQPHRPTLSSKPHPFLLAAQQNLASHTALGYRPGTDSAIDSIVQRPTTVSSTDEQMVQYYVLKPVSIPQPRLIGFVSATPPAPTGRSLITSPASIDRKTRR